MENMRRVIQPDGAMTTHDFDITCDANRLAKLLGG